MLEPKKLQFLKASWLLGILWILCGCIRQEMITKEAKEVQLSSSSLLKKTREIIENRNTHFVTLEKTIEKIMRTAREADRLVKKYKGCGKTCNKSLKIAQFALETSSSAFDDLKAYANTIPNMYLVFCCDSKDESGHHYGCQQVEGVLVNCDLKIMFGCEAGQSNPDGSLSCNDN